ncbi:hypothetical protein GCM10023169_34890 [Georgenia halophila]|uniref:FCD domain-containing protein n=1 Tax=Georgenia halophila TaxID=620889 RepID=A0ABP8LJQ2_9MICO
MTTQEQADLDTETFREAAGHFTSGVAVITTAAEGRLYGTTVSAVVALSDEPPMMLVCLNQTSSTHDAVVLSGTFAINILAEHQAQLARQFARKGDKFTGVEHRLSEHGGVPLLDSALASIVCRVDSRTGGGTHSVFLGTALAAEAVPGRPLAYFRGSFGRLDRLREQDTYDQVRRLVLQRDVPVGQELDVDVLAATFDARPDDVHNALVKLSMESLVERDPDGRFMPTPINVDLIENLYDARANIEIGVVVNHTGRVPDDVLDRMSAIVARMETLRQTPGADPQEFLSLHTAHHTALVELSGSTQLVDSYKRLSIAWVWRPVWNEVEWQSFLGHAHLDELTAALADGDLAAAITAVQQYNEQAKELARVAIARRGGAV